MYKGRFVFFKSMRRRPATVQLSCHALQGKRNYQVSTQLLKWEERAQASRKQTSRTRAIRTKNETASSTGNPQEVHRSAEHMVHEWQRPTDIKSRSDHTVPTYMRFDPNNPRSGPTEQIAMRLG